MKTLSVSKTFLGSWEFSLQVLGGFFCAFDGGSGSDLSLRESDNSRRSSFFIFIEEETRGSGKETAAKVRKVRCDADRSVLCVLPFYFALCGCLKRLSTAVPFISLRVPLPCVSAPDEDQRSFTSHLHFELN